MRDTADTAPIRTKEQTGKIRWNPEVKSKFFNFFDETR
jgi:hypothetical protein